MVESSLEIEKPGCECAIAGVYSHVDNVTPITVTLLHHQTHRAQEGAGIVTYNDSQVTREYRDSGWAKNVFTKEVVATLSETNPSIAIGHNRYSVSGEPDAWQPFLVNGIALGHNGNLTNARKILSALPVEMRNHIGSDTDIVSRRLNMLIADCDGDLLQACRKLGGECEGAFNFIIGGQGKLIAMRDPWGFHPLSIGINGSEDDPANQTYVVASETSAYISPLQMRHLRDVYPGEGVVIDETGVKTFYMDERTENVPSAQCIFELIYFASPDAVIFGKHVGTIRNELGRALARRDIANGYEPGKIVPVQQSGIVHAVGYAQEYIEHSINKYIESWTNNEQEMDVATFAKKVADLHIQFGLIRNPYSGRAFIDPGDKRLATSGKHRADTNVVGAQRVTLIDDSIVKGNAQYTIQELLRSANASSVDVRIAAPPILFPCFWGVDFPDQSKLIASHANGSNIEGYVTDKIKAESVRYLPALETLKIVIGDERFQTLLDTQTADILQQATLVSTMTDPRIGEIYKHSDYCGTCFHGNNPTDISGVYQKN